MTQNANQHAINFARNPNSGVAIVEIVSPRILVVESRSGFGVWIDGTVHKATNKDKGRRAIQWAKAMQRRHDAA